MGWKVQAALLKINEFLHSCKQFIHTFATLMALQMLLVYYVLGLGFVLSKMFMLPAHSYAIGVVRDDPGGF